MAKVQSHTGLTSIQDPKEYMRFSSQAISDIGDTVNGKLEFDKNMNTQTVEIEFKTAFIDVAVSHSLGRIVSKYMKVQATTDCTIFDGSKENTKTTIYLQSTKPAKVTLLLY